MSIRFKLILVFSIVIGFAGCLAVFAVRAISDSSELVVRMYDEPLMGINEARAAHTKLVGAIVQMQRAMAFREAPGRAADELEKTVLGAIEDLQTVRERVHGVDVRTAVDAAELAARKWLDAGLAILRARPEGRTELPTTFAVGKLGDAMVVAVDDLVELAAAHGFDFRQRAEAATRTARAQMIALSVGVGLLSLIVALTFAYSLARPIQAAMTIAANVASGNFSDKIEVSRRDDLGRLLQSLGTMQASLKARAQEQAETAAARERMHAEQDQLRRDVTTTLAAAFEEKVGRLVLGLESAATQLESTARSMSSTAETTNQQAAIVADNAEQAAANVDAVSGATGELAASAHEIFSLVRNSVELINHAVEGARQTDKTVLQLENGAQKIGDIVKLIGEIASQTNLLALNATIEAARAGQAGKGFAVVANEVKSLASQTARATDEVAAQISRIQDATGNTVAAIHGISKFIQDVSATACAVERALERQQCTTAVIAANVGSATRGTQEVAMNIGHVLEAAGSTGTAADDVLAAAQELARGAQVLNRELIEFLHGIRAA
jgi:methyl-accepting chemotaxis protein